MITTQDLDNLIKQYKLRGKDYVVLAIPEKNRPLARQGGAVELWDGASGKYLMRAINPTTREWDIMVRIPIGLLEEAMNASAMAKVMKDMSHHRG